MGCPLTKGRSGRRFVPSIPRRSPRASRQSGNARRSRQERRPPGRRRLSRGPVRRVQTPVQIPKGSLRGRGATGAPGTKPVLTASVPGARGVRLPPKRSSPTRARPAGDHGMSGRKTQTAGPGGAAESQTQSANGHGEPANRHGEPANRHGGGPAQVKIKTPVRGCGQGSAAVTEAAQAAPAAPEQPVTGVAPEGRRRPPDQPVTGVALQRAPGVARTGPAAQAREPAADDRKGPASPGRQPTGVWGKSGV